jgi:enoyl-CoA hydratase/3-hydroxyacyl-CoA dehydrogenase
MPFGVVGAGNMGSGIAQKMATEGFDVILVDVDDAKVARGLAIIERTLAEGVERKIFAAEQAERIRRRISGTSRFEDLAEAELVIEAVFEDLAVKKDVFSRLDRICGPQTILATNTSSYAVTDLAAATGRPERVLGLHYFYHPAKNKLVEVIPGARTDPALFRRAWALQEMQGKTPIASRDSYGFIVNRFFSPWLNEAVRIVEEGAANVATVEQAARKAFGIGMGPFELMNVTGVPIAFHTAETLGRAFGPLYGPPAALRAQVDSGRPWDLSGAPDAARFEAVADRLAAVTFHVAASLVDEGVGTIEDTDIGARVGLRWQRGPFELMNQYGVDRSLALASLLAATWKIPVPQLLARQAATGQPFGFAWVRSEIADGIGTVTINRPDAMNALNEDVVAQLGDSFRRLAADPGVRAIVIAGSGKAFIAGADIRFFLRNIESRELGRTRAFTQQGLDLLRDIAAASKPVVARVNGLALGGGVEVALACHYIVASPRATFAFPETGIGIYPGLGGTQRTTRRIGRGLAKWLVLTGQTVGADEALAIGLVDRVVPHDQLDAAIVDVVRSGPVGERTPHAPPDTHRALAEFFERHDADALREGHVGGAANDRVAKAVRRVASKAPMALRIAGDLIDRGAGMTLEEGLAMELSHLEEIFSTRDAYEGLSSLGKRAPVFEGR